MIQRAFHLPHPWFSRKLLQFQEKTHGRCMIQRAFHLPHPWFSRKLLHFQEKTHRRCMFQRTFHLPHPVYLHKVLQFMQKTHGRCMVQRAFHFRHLPVSCKILQFQDERLRCGMILGVLHPLHQASGWKRFHPPTHTKYPRLRLRLCVIVHVTDQRFSLRQVAAWVFLLQRVSCKTSF